jgi:hypothetical protein
MMRFHQIYQRLDAMLSGVRKTLRSGPVPTVEDIAAQLRAVDDFDLSLDSDYAVLIARRALHPDNPGVIPDGNYLPYLHGKVHQYFGKVYAMQCLDAARQTLRWYRSEGNFWTESDMEIICYFARAGFRPTLRSQSGLEPQFDIVQGVCRILSNEQFRNQPRTPQLDAALRKAFAEAFGDEVPG